MKRWMAVAGLLLAWDLSMGAGSCKPPKPPEPTCPSCPEGQICPDPKVGCVAPPAECLPGIPWCDSVTPPATCGGCKLTSCEMAPACPPEPPTPPTCPAECPAGTSCTDPSKGCVAPPPTPSGDCVISGEPTEMIEGYRQRLGDRVNAAIVARYPTCEVGSRCVITERPQEYQAAIEAKLRFWGLCAGQHSAGTDEIAVAAAPDTPWEGWHIYAGPGWDDPAATGTVVWAPNAATKTWKPAEGVPGCSNPVTPKVARWGLTLRNRWWDATPQFYGKDTATWTGVPVSGYCAAIGFPDRLFCPARSECPGMLCEERRACEGYGIGGYANAVPLWRCENGAPEINPVQPFQARCDPGWMEVCAMDSSTCLRVTLEVVP